MIYLDSCIVIYLVEPSSESHGAVLDALARSADDRLAISPLVVMECLGGPLAAHDAGLRRDYERVFATLTSVPMGFDVYRRAAELRARTRLRTPDALHLAAAQESGCTELWTDDDRLSQAAEGLARVVGR